MSSTTYEHLDTRRLEEARQIFLDAQVALDEARAELLRQHAITSRFLAPH